MGLGWVVSCSGVVWGAAGGVWKGAGAGDPAMPVSGRQRFAHWGLDVPSFMRGEGRCEWNRWQEYAHHVAAQIIRLGSAAGAYGLVCPGVLAPHEAPLDPRPNLPPGPPSTSWSASARTVPAKPHQSQPRTARSPNPDTESTGRVGKDRDRAITGSLSRFIIGYSIKPIYSLSEPACPVDQRGAWLNSAWRNGCSLKI
jgi:hypothetical protein